MPILAQTAPTVAISVTGTPVPGATVTAKATVTIKDGSTLQGVSWKQVGGPTAVLANTNTDTITVTLPDRKTFKHHLIEVLGEPPIAETTYPDYVPQAHFYAGLQNRWGLVASSPHAVIDAANLVFEVTTVTSSGTYKSNVTLAGKMPWITTLGVNAVPINSPVLLHGKTQASYNWTLVVPTGSKSVLVDATTQDPDFTPDVKGTYTVTVTDLTANKPVTLTIHAGMYKGIVAGKDPVTNKPVVSKECTSCHAGKIDMFPAWANTGHATIFADNVNTLNNHYGEACLSCHTVGFNKDAANGGVDDASDYAAFAGAGLMYPGALTNWSTIVEKYPKTASLSNIQCDNCHGPTDTPAHPNWEANARVSLSSDLCGTCHGEPLRHGRFQQWQLSRHGNYETAIGEGMSAGCAKCHSANGFLQWAGNGFSTAAIKVDWTEDQIHPVTCVVCHDPHNIGTTSGSAATNAPMRIEGTTPMLDSGFVVKDAGKSAICMTCHNSRRGIRNDTVAMTDLSRATHLGPQTDILVGQNMYFVETGTKGYHGMMADACVACHMEKTAPPPLLSYNSGGTNHTFFASKTICSKCHTNITAASVQHEVETTMHELATQIELALVNAMKAQIRAGNVITLASTPVTTIKSANDIVGIEYIESHGRQGANVILADGKKVSDLALNSIKVLRPTGTSVEIYATMDPNVAKAGWNYWMVHSDGSEGVHNPTFVKKALDVSLFAVKQYNTYTTTYTNPLVVSAKLGGGLGNGQGAVACTTPYVYWTEMAGHIPGNAGSNWRTDLVARNLGTKNAALKFILHTETGKVEGTGAVNASALKAFENIAGTIGATGKMGSLELCSDQPLLVSSRTFNQTDNGTYGQAFDGQVADVGYSVGQTVSLIGLRQKTGAFRSNIIVTNAGMAAAEVSVTLFDGAGTSLKTYTLTVPAGQSVNDVEPFKNRVAAADVDWAFATVTVLKGTNVWASGSMIDMKTNDPLTVLAKQ
ncbi:MAG: hypothetical protein WA208_15955 [Thermoanaerobaculia bacterium]